MKDTTKVTRGSRPKRASIGTRNRMPVVNKAPDKEYRFVNDRDGRVEMFLQNGWEVELAETHKQSLARTDVSSVEGSAARYPVGLGDNAVLLSIPKEWYQEDQIEKQRLVDSTEQSIKNEAEKSHKGSFQVSRGPLRD
jgi:hypothetical protein